MTRDTGTGTGAVRYPADMPAESSPNPLAPDPADEVAALRAAREELLAAVSHWRARALEGWASAPAVTATATAPQGDLAAARAEAERWHAEVLAMRQTLSWRLTRPLRAVRRAAR